MASDVSECSLDFVLFMSAVDLFCDIVFTFDCLIGVRNCVASVIVPSVYQFKVVSNTL